MPHIQELLAGRLNELNYPDLLTRYPWIVRKNKKCILSPDSDGLLCGLFMSKYLDWKIIGYYDGKVMLLKEGESTYDEDVVFLDMEIYRSHVKSVGHHMVLLNKNRPPSDWNNFSNCIQLNNLRTYDGKHDFRLKYPLATIHFLLGTLGTQFDIEIPTSAIAPLFFTDGTFNVLYSYPENVLNWLNFLGIENPNSPLRKVFMHDHFSVYEQIKVMDEFFRKRDLLNKPGERGDKFAISESNGQFKNIQELSDGTYKITNEEQSKVRGFINLLAETTTWEFEEKKWTFEGLKRYKFSKGSFDRNGWTVSDRDYNKLMELKPLSWAMTSGQNIEYTLEEPDTLP
ncbi:MAG: hypothetical protein HYV29_10500 [Ignavibacteriales bacterium]|nr:hypothetical protein [Ignavibacteriales bacterium]